MVALEESDSSEYITFLKDLFMKTREVLLINFGGVGEYIFQLDFSKRLEDAGKYKVIILTRKNYNLFQQFLQCSNLKYVQVKNGEGYRFFTHIFLTLALVPFRKISVINAFDVKGYSLLTRLFYRGVSILGGKVVLYGTDDRFRHKRIIFLPQDEREMIWKRNARIVRLLEPQYGSLVFPVVSLKGENPLGVSGYIHFHVVASILAKSYPPQRTVDLIKGLSRDYSVVVTMTPREMEWYFTKDQLNELQQKGVKVISKFFTASEIIGILQNSLLFCTVNTGLLWLARFLNKKTVVLDTFTDYEWNPAPYRNVIRLGHDLDAAGHSLHSVKTFHPEGEFFESLYLISLEEAEKAIRGALAS
jgi:hypothetical protein